jgi:hypothetical protein
MTLARSAPGKADDFVQGGAAASASGGRKELFCEHKSSFRASGKNDHS